MGHCIFLKVVPDFFGIKVEKFPAWLKIEPTALFIYPSKI